MWLIINAQLDIDLIQIDDGDWEKIILYVEVILTLEMSNALVKKGKLKNTVTHSFSPTPCTSYLSARAGGHIT